MSGVETRVWLTADRDDVGDDGDATIDRHQPSTANAAHAIPREQSRRRRQTRPPKLRPMAQNADRDQRTAVDLRAAE